MFHAEPGCTDFGLNTTSAMVLGCTKVNMWEGYTIDCR